ncbi:hypothetical protein IFM89_024938 [Coptis chinensis]|uniref:Uncharacterized protein n=1 Tax=Coptis chinensis TaxID=261450 RepID=A0A835I542_9MAGN|nr:hypothetical protein IFM89_024938 [Coptis chinensis]
MGHPNIALLSRFTNKDIITRFVSTSIAGDMILTSAYAHELPDMGLMLVSPITLQLLQTGLLLARGGVLKTLSRWMSSSRKNVEATGKIFLLSSSIPGRPFRALLDVGLIRTTTGALKGALDGGLDIPHSDKRFVGFKKENKQLDAGVHRKYL